MKTALLLAVTIVTFSSLPLVARRGVEDQAAHPPEKKPQARAVVAKLLGRLDAGAVRRGDPVFATTEGDTRTPEGTLIPEGTRLIGHVQDVRALNAAHEDSSMRIAFDSADLVGGQRMPIHSVLRAISPGNSPRGSQGADDTGAAGDTGSAAQETAVPGVLLAGTSGTLSSLGGNVTLASGTRLILTLTLPGVD